MDIERLKELKDYLRVANELSILNDDNLMQRIIDNNDVTNTIDIAIELLNAEIARQSVKSEDVQEAINEFESAFDEEVIVNGLIGVCSEYQFKVETIDLAITALRAQIEPGWIKVSERLPEIYQQDNDEPMEFIVMIKGAIVPTVLSYNGTEWFQMDWTNTRAGSSYAVTHWMPLPEPPKGE